MGYKPILNFFFVKNSRLNPSYNKIKPSHIFCLQIFHKPVKKSPLSLYQEQTLNNQALDLPFVRSMFDKLPAQRVSN